ncbi:T9SS type B sorting domain-containing protein [Aquimarina rubra]|uniref:Gliding motility-associated C-terminal domain-containing protein n=1 Tax=Aquimarina rubra TaxID=1920033 RepID=A0ABW5LE25_9FLAO
MKTYKTKLLFILLIVFGSFGAAIAQCNQTQTISICDMETIDFDNDGDPDGIVNLYTETGIAPQPGDTWFDPGFNFALDSGTGNLRLWDLDNASEEENDYVFILRNANCTDNQSAIINLVLGPYSGEALPPAGPNEVNVEVCDVADPCAPEILFDINLFSALTSLEGVPSPHLNGEWNYVGDPDKIVRLVNSNFGTTVAYIPGGDLVDQEEFEFTYTVPGLDPFCNSSAITNVKVSVVRQVSSGFGSSFNICEGELISGDFDVDIDLRDDRFLIAEDEEGVWSIDDDGQITNPDDSSINLRMLYDNLLATNPRFGCQEYSFRYNVDQRSVACSDVSTEVSFTFYEQLRPFRQSDAPAEFCSDDIATPTTDLYDFLEFTEENGVLYDYPDGSIPNDFIKWSLVSGPSDLRLAANLADLDITPIDERHRGIVNLQGAPSGTYIFRYTVDPKKLCANVSPEIRLSPNFCEPEIDIEHPCEEMFTDVTIVIYEEDYAGEDTTGLNFCETQDSVDLRSLLNTNGNIVDTEGVWTDSNGNIVENIFDIPEITGTQTFTFTYSTISDNGCRDEAVLSFTVFTEANAGAGTGTTTTLCSDNLTVTLFDLLQGNPDTTGIWTGPFGYTSPDHLGVFDAFDTALPILGPGDYVYTVTGNAGCSGTDQATVTIEIVDPVQIGNDRSDSFCEIDGRVNLFTILDNDTPRTGSFQDIENTGALTPEGVVEFDLLPNPDNEINKIYNFRYVIPNTAPCDESSLNVEVQIIDLPEPNVPDQEFCILDAKRLDDIEVDVLNYNWYPTLESDMPIIDNPLLFDNQVFYIATVDADNCESERVTVNINILNMGERFSNGDLCTLDFQDGVSPDGNNQNDTFDLFIEGEFNIPVAFPDFDLKIYNRYGAAVYEGNRNTEPFRGESNVSLRLGDDLPSGTYFYIFTPNFENNFPIQGSFYLSR